MICVGNMGGGCMKKLVGIISLMIAVITLLAACSSGVGTSSQGTATDNALSTAMFKVDMPAKFDGLYETKVKDNGIDFYDKECMSQGNPGWVFGVYVYDDPSEWAGGPIEKVGELKLSDGKTYDVVIVYPTETQFGLDRPMPEKYKNLYEARFDIAKTVSGLNGEKVAAGEGAKGEKLYKSELENLITAIKEKWDSDKLESENLSTMYVTMDDGNGDVLDKVGYAYKDLNIDGIEELVIGETDGNSDGVIYDIFTMVDRKPKHVVSGWDRNRYYSYEGGMIVNEYSNGADESGVDVYTLTTNSTELFPQVSYKYDGYTDENNPWYIAYDKKGDDWDYKSVSEQQYNELDNRFSKHEKIDFKALSTIK